MSSLLYPQPQGALMDPRSQMITQMGLGLLSAGGPQSTPMGLGQAFGQAGQQGLQAFQQANQANQQQQIFAMKMAEVQREAEERKKKEAAIAALMQDPRFAQYAPLLQAGLPIASVLERASPKPQTLSPGGRLVGPNGEVIAEAPFKPDAPQKPTPPMTRQVPMGDQVVTQEYVNGEWREVGRGARFQPVKPPTPPKAPPGFRFKKDSDELEPIPGGPKDTAPKDAARAAGAIQKADIVIGKVDEALKNIGFTSTGLTGKVLGMVPGTKAYDLDKTIDTIKAQLGFSELQAMREASPTGGALGQVAVIELQMLQSTVASLEHGQSEEQVKRALGQVKKHFENWKKAVKDSQKSAQPDATTTPDAPKRRVFNPKTGKFE